MSENARSSRKSSFGPLSFSIRTPCFSNSVFNFEIAPVGSGAIATATMTGVAQYYYEATLDLNTTELLAGVAAAVGNQLSCMMDIEVQDSGNTKRLTFQISVIARQQALSGSEGVPTSGSPPYPVPSTIALVSQATPISVANNIAKLALTSLAAGQIVKITGEANRIEQYLGGTISSEANWLVLANTFEVIVSMNLDSGTSTSVNGIPFTNGMTASIGWFAPCDAFNVGDTLTSARWKGEVDRFGVAHGDEVEGSYNSGGIIFGTGDVALGPAFAGTDTLVMPNSAARQLQIDMHVEA